MAEGSSDAAAADGELTPNQLYQTLIMLAGVRDGSLEHAVTRITQTHGVAALRELLLQFAPVFLAADEETQRLYSQATVGEGDARAAAALIDRLKPLLSQSSAAGTIFDDDEVVSNAVVAPADVGGSSGGDDDDGDGGQDMHDAEGAEFEETDDGEDAGEFVDATQDGSGFRMHELVYNGDVEGLRAYVIQYPSELHLLDSRGNTPTHLAVLRCNLACVELLLEAGFDVEVKNSAGWTALEDAVVQGDIPILRTLLRAAHASNLKMWLERKPLVLDALRSMPDFKMRMAWEFGSPVFSGLVKQFAPYDEYTIYKVGAKLRIDAGIVGYEGMKWVRGDVSLRFDGDLGEEELCIVNHDERKVFQKDAGMFAGPQDADSLDAEVDFLLSAEMVQVNVQTSNTTFEMVRQRLRDAPKTEQIGPWTTTVFAASSDLEIERKAKTGSVGELPATFAAYLQPPQVPGRARRHFGRRARRQPSPEEQVQIIRKKATGRTNMVENFPISTAQLVNIMEMVAPLNREVAKARSFLEEKVPPGLFPVKARIPVYMGVHLSIAFHSFEPLSQDDPSWWHIPPEYERKSMKEQLEVLGDKMECMMREEQEKEDAERRTGPGLTATVDNNGVAGDQDKAPAEAAVANFAAAPAGAEPASSAAGFQDMASTDVDIAEMQTQR